MGLAAGFDLGGVLTNLQVADNVFDGVWSGIFISYVGGNIDVASNTIRNVSGQDPNSAQAMCVAPFS